MSNTATCPLLQRGVDFDSQGRWPVVLHHPCSGNMGRDFGAIFHLYSGPQLLARHANGRLVLMKHYASDGYSPVIRVFGKFVYLTPWPKCGVWPALGHDVMRQFVGVEGCPWDRIDTDLCFYNWLTAGGVHPDVAGTYYGAVAGVVGDIFINLTRKPDPDLWIERIEYA